MSQNQRSLMKTLMVFFISTGLLHTANAQQQAPQENSAQESTAQPEQFRAIIESIRNSSAFLNELAPRLESIISSLPTALEDARRNIKEIEQYIDGVLTAYGDNSEVWRNFDKGVELSNERILNARNKIAQGDQRFSESLKYWEAAKNELVGTRRKIRELVEGVRGRRNQLQKDRDLMEDSIARARMDEVREILRTAVQGLRTLKDGLDSLAGRLNRFPEVGM